MKFVIYNTLYYKVVCKYTYFIYISVKRPKNNNFLEITRPFYFVCLRGLIGENGLISRRRDYGV